jgi:hypothetical protein
MDMETVGWLVLGWFTVALVISLVLGGFLRKVNTTLNQDDLDVVASRQKVMRYMRGRKPAVGRHDKMVSQIQGQDKRAAG